MCSSLSLPLWQQHEENTDQYQTQESGPSGSPQRFPLAGPHEIPPYVQICVTTTVKMQNWVNIQGCSRHPPGDTRTPHPPNTDNLLCFLEQTA